MQLVNTLVKVRESVDGNLWKVLTAAVEGTSDKHGTGLLSMMSKELQRLRGRRDPIPAGGKPPMSAPMGKPITLDIR